MVHYKLFKITINVLELFEIILDIIVLYYSLPNPIVSAGGFLFILKFWSLFNYFLSIKQKLSTTFHPKTGDKTKR